MKPKTKSAEHLSSDRHKLMSLLDQLEAALTEDGLENHQAQREQETRQLAEELDALYEEDRDWDPMTAYLLDDDDAELGEDEDIKALLADDDDFDDLND